MGSPPTSATPATPAGPATTVSPPATPSPHGADLAHLPGSSSLGAASGPRPTLSAMAQACLGVPGAVEVAAGEIELNSGLPRTRLVVVNLGDRPVQVGSHYHFAEANVSLSFERELARGQRLDIPAGTAVRFEPGQQRTVTLVPYQGLRRVVGFLGAVMGPLEP